MRAVEYSLLAVFHLVLVMAVYAFIIQPATVDFGGHPLAGVVTGEAATVPAGVAVVRDEDGNIRPATTEEEVESLVLNGIPGGAGSVEGWFQQILDTLP